MLSLDTGSRTIQHHNAGAPEVDAALFRDAIRRHEFGWIHFEGRVNAAEIVAMIAHARTRERTDKVGAKK